VIPVSALLRATSPDRAYAVVVERLDRCIGFRVDDENGRVGTVTAVAIDAASGEPAWLEVRTGLFARREVAISVHDVRSVDPLAHRILTIARPDRGTAR
jgi:PRC-barrel domain protein